MKFILRNGKDIIEIDKTALNTNSKVVIVDDLIATGGTAIAATELIKKCKANIYELSFLIDLPELSGSQKLNDKGFKTFTLIKFEGK